MKNIQTDILIIGAGPAGLVAASTASENYPEKNIVLVKEYEKGKFPVGFLMCSVRYSMMLKKMRCLVAEM